MPVTITYTGATPTVDASEDIWGDELNNDALHPIKADLDALAAQGNASEAGIAGAVATAGAALPRAGGTMTGALVLPATSGTNPLEAGFRGVPVVNFDANTSLALTHNGKALRQNGVTARTVTIPASGLPVSFAVLLRPYSAQPINVVRAPGVQLRVGGSALDKNCSVAAFGHAWLWQEDANIWIISGPGVS